MPFTIDVSESPLLRSVVDRVYEEGARAACVQIFDETMEWAGLRPTEVQRAVLLSLDNQRLRRSAVRMWLDPRGAPRTYAERLDHLEAIVSRVEAETADGAEPSTGEPPSCGVSVDAAVLGRRNKEVVESSAASGTHEGARRALATLVDAWMVDFYTEDRVPLLSQSREAAIDLAGRLAACATQPEAQAEIDDFLQAATGREPLGRKRRREGRA